MIKWHLEQVIFPKVTYAYHKLLKSPHFFTKLQQLSRVTLLQTSPCRTHTHIAGMQIILGVMPLAIRARYKNLAAWLRINNYQTIPPPDVTLPPFSWPLTIPNSYIKPPNKFSMWWRTIWGFQHSISFCPKKTKVVYFNWNPDPAIFPPLSL